MATLDRIYNIARTGQTAEKAAADNIMAQYKPREQAQGGFWNGIKNFAGSNGGRLLLGSLVGTAAGALDGNGWQGALQGTIAGGTGAAGGITQREKYSDMIARRQQERADRLKQIEDGRKFQVQMLQDAAAVQRDAADLAFARKMKEISEIRTYNERQKANELLQNEAYIDTLSVDEGEKQRLKAGLRGLNLSAPKNRIETLQDEYLSPDTTTERKAKLEPMIADYYRFQNRLAALMSQDRLSFRDFAAGAENLAKAGATSESLSEYAKDSGYNIAFAAAPKKYATGDLGTIQYLVDAGKGLDEASQMVGLLSPEEKIAFEAQKAGAVKGAEAPFVLAQQNNAAQNSLNNSLAMARTSYEYGQRAADAQAERDKELEKFRNSLPGEAQRAISAQAQALNIPERAIYQQAYNERQAKIQQNLADINKTIAAAEKTKAQTGKINRELLQPYVSPAEEAAQKEEAKQRIKLEYDQLAALQKAEQERKEDARQNEIMRPRLEAAIARAREALDDGSGLGQVGGWGWTTDQGGRNRADINTAQAQINTMMRGLLKEMGVGSTELNSAAEAAAYRYQISPDMPKEQIARVLDDFERDYLDGSLKQDLSTVARQYGGGDLSSVSTDDLVGML